MKKKPIRHATGWVLAALVGVVPPALRAQQDPAIYGQWSDPKDLKLTNPAAGEPTDPMAPEHGILLRNGKVLLVDILHSFPDDNPGKENRPDIILFDPTDESIELVWEEGISGADFPNDHRLYCSGHVVLADGRVVFRGGQNEGPGNFKTTLYDPATNSFIAGPDEEWCFRGDTCDGPNPDPLTETLRWYPTLTLLGSGNVLVTDGWRSHSYPADGSPNTPVVLKVDSGAPADWQWEVLYGAEYCDFGTGSCYLDAPKKFDLNLYPYMFVAGNGHVFLGGSQYGDPFNSKSQKSRKLDVGFGTWVNGFKPPTPLMAASAVLYAENKVLIAGGATSNHVNGCDATTASSEVYDIDIVQNGAQWSTKAIMDRSRINCHLLSLADGEILALGGSNELGPDEEVCHPDNHVLVPEKYDPISDDWSDMAAISVPRGSHSVALLLPDGSVFFGGGDYKGAGGAGPARNYQIYQPPYFFDPAGRRSTVHPTRFSTPPRST